MPGQQQAVNGGEDVDGVALMVEQRARRKADEDVVEPRVEDAAERGLARYCAVMVQDVLRCADAAGSGSAADIFQLAGKRARSGDPEDAPASSKIPVKPPQ
ncbi:hypothetical protein H109_00480 [Trichophyton interdigitale MR816]|uniref:Uncharacterized protein n=1 Tax=Trichophyton interdigitale (strain MR816) TaxID=1215338 RepID=A0A059JJ18_TRIIM|nr:hypothetical protein H109_00480 [Trichophyton interdigitale MR816]